MSDVDRERALFTLQEIAAKNERYAKELDQLAKSLQAGLARDCPIAKWYVWVRSCGILAVRFTIIVSRIEFVCVEEMSERMARDLRANVSDCLIDVMLRRLADALAKWRPE